MKNLFNEAHLEEMKARVKKLKNESVARWGQFTVHRMMCHLLDQLEYASGITEGVKEVVAGPENRDKESWPIHPFFGRLTGPAWAR